MGYKNNVGLSIDKFTFTLTLGHEILRGSGQQESENLKIEKGLLLEVRERMVFMNLQDRREG